jgi:hypothetical protein
LPSESSNFSVLMVFMDFHRTEVLIVMVFIQSTVVFALNFLCQIYPFKALPSAAKVRTLPSIRSGSLFHFIKAEALNDVIIYHPDCLHEGIANSRSNEVEASFLQVFAYRVGLLGTGRQFG